MAKKYQMHVISGTHWDREWRHTAEQSKLRLADLMDNILNVLETNPAYKCFCVDGGMIVIEDYLSIRPENEERIRKLIQAKRMIVVNWYTLPETNTVAPEALIRNLLLGHKMAASFGGGMKSGYTATSYGQHSQMPQLYRGFGIDTAIFYRGTNKYEYTPLFKWEGADGSTLDTLRTFDEVTRTNWFFYVHQPVVVGKPAKNLEYTYDRSNDPVHPADMGLYEKAFVVLKEDHDFNHDPEVLKKSLKDIFDQAAPYAIKNQILALNMEDNDEPYKNLPQLIDEINKVSDDIEVIQQSMDEYMDCIRSKMPESEMARHKGELRYTTMDFGSFNALLGATHSSRIKIKLFNEKVENNLINLAEPLASFAEAYGKEYPRTNIDRAWSALLKNHAHDSICGAAVDLAHEDMMYNFSIANTVAEEVTSRSMIGLFANMNTAKDFKETDHTITFYNTLPYERHQVVPVVIDIPKSAISAAALDIGVDVAGAGKIYYDIVDKDGKEQKYIELYSEDVKIGVERELDTKAIKFAAKRLRLLIEVTIPAMGYATYALRMRAPKLALHPQIGPNRPLIARDKGVLENEHLKVEINPNGTFNLTDKATGRKMEKLHYFTDGGEVGSAHASIKPTRDFVITSLGSNATITMVETNELRGTFKIDLTMRIPAAATIDGSDRTREYKDLPITTWVTLKKGSKFVEIKTKLHNECRDHKLWVNFPSGINTDWAVSESAWDVAKRSIKYTENFDNFEQFYAFQPMQTFVDLSDGKDGLAFISKGLREYEVQDDAERTLAITLIRTQRAYMTANANMNVEELDKYTGQHSFGDLTYEYALYPHTGDWKEGNVLTTAYDFKVDVKALQGVTRDGVLPSTASFIKISRPGDVMVSAVKQAEDGNGTILRLWNSTGENFDLDVETILPVKAVTQLRLDETVVEKEIAISNGKFSVTMAPHKIVTLRLTY